MKILKIGPGCNLFLGHQGEKLALRVVFDITEWIDTYGNGTAHLLHQRKGDAEPYPVGTVQEGSVVRWDVSEADTAVEGSGKYELHFYTGEALVKSVTGETLVRGALQYGAEPPEAVQLWLDHVAEEEHKIYQAVADTEAARDAAVGAADNAAASAQTAGAAAATAAQGKEDANAAAGNAKASEEAAAKSAVEAKNAAIKAKGIDVTAQPGQLIRVKEVDAEGKPTAWENFPHLWVEETTSFVYEETVDLVNGDEFYATPPFVPIDGKTYKVDWNGAMYECVAHVVTVTEGETSATAGWIGNPTRVFYSSFYEQYVGAITDTGEPFVFEYTVISGNPNMWIRTSEGDIEVTFKVDICEDTVHKLPGKFLPDGVPYIEGGMVEILPETTLTASEEEPGEFVVTENPPTLEVGKIYTVNWNGIEYTATAMDGAEIGLDGAIVAQNDGADFTTGEGMVFMLVNANGVFGVMDSSNSMTLTISIWCEGETVHKLDNKFLDLDWIPTKKVKETVVLPEMLTSEYTNELKPTSLPIGTVVAVYWDGVRHECTVSTVEGAEGAHYFGYLSRNPFMFLALYQNLPYTIDCADGEEHTVSVSLLEYEYNVIPAGYLGESTTPISLIDLGMPSVGTDAEVTFSTDTSEIMKNLKNGGKAKVIFKIVTTAGTPTITAVFDGTHYFLGIGSIGDAFLFSTMLYESNRLYAITLRVKEGQYDASVRKLLDNSAS